MLSELIETHRLVLRRPRLQDAEAVFSRWASISEATLFMSWPRHRSVKDSEAFLEFSEGEWASWPAGPYLIEHRRTGELIGSCGFGFCDPHVAEVGYILSPQCWGFGYATEALSAQIDAAIPLGSLRLQAAVHPDNRASAHVLEKCGFSVDAGSEVLVRFPNLSADRLPAIRYLRHLG